MTLEISDYLWIRSTLLNAYHEGSIEFDIENVPYADTYAIEVGGRKQNEMQNMVLVEISH